MLRPIADLTRQATSMSTVPSGSPISPPDQPETAPRVQSLMPPLDTLAKVRRLLLRVALLNAVLTIGIIASSHSTGLLLQLAAIASVLGMCALWLYGYRRGHFSPLTPAAEGLVIALAALAMDEPLGALLLVYGTVFFRSLYGARRDVTLLVPAILTAFLGAMILAPEQGTGPIVPLAFFQIPNVVLVAVMQHLLAGALRKDGQSSRQEGVLRNAAMALVSAISHQDVYAATWRTTSNLAKRRPGTTAHLLTGSTEQLVTVGPNGDPVADSGEPPFSYADIDEEDMRRRLLAGEVVVTTAAAVPAWCERLQIIDRRQTLLLAPLVAGGKADGLLVLSGEQAAITELRDGLETLAAQVTLALESTKQPAAGRNRVNEAKFGALVQHSSDVTVVIDRSGMVRYVSPSVRRVLGYRPELMSSSDIFSFLQPEDLDRVREWLAEDSAHARPRAPIDLRVRHHDGGWRHVEVIATNLLDHPDVRGIVLNARDITDHKALERALAYQALHDALTGLPNRGLFREHLSRALTGVARRHDPVAVLVFDLAGLQPIIDSLGPAAGDRLLIEMSRRIHTCLPANQTLARLGSTEFAVLVEDARSHDVAHIAERLLNAVRQPIEVAGRALALRGAAGVAFGVTGAETPDDLLRNAGLAMYKAKARGADCYEIFEPGMHAAALARLELEGELRRAIEHDDFVLHYQPIVDLTSGAITGVEALVRWNHGQRGLLMPASFIAVAEETGMIVPLGDRILQLACRQMRQWVERYPAIAGLTLNVNISARQLQQPELVPEVARILAETGFDPNLLVLEITETLLMHDTDVTIERLQQLTRLGVRIALDDFGTGFSSLSYLQRFPVDLIKVDQVFTRQLSDARDGALARAIISLGHSLGVRTAAEGVETAGQLAILQDLNCDLAQGYHLAHPMDATAFEALLIEGGGSDRLIIHQAWAEQRYLPA